MFGISFSKWDEIEQFIMKQTGCKAYSGAGINPRIKKKTTILRSVDNTYYYDDDMSDINNVEYTLFGQIGNQDETEKKFNEPLLNRNKTHHIYLYRVKIDGKKKEYIWYGKYEITGKYNKQHIDKNYINRNIVILSLKRISL